MKHIIPSKLYSVHKFLQASMPQLTMEEKIPADRVALVPERSLRSRRLSLLQKSNSSNDMQQSSVSEVIWFIITQKISVMHLQFFTLYYRMLYCRGYEDLSRI